MGVLYDPTRAMDTFVLTPDYDMLLAEWAEANPNHPDPRFNADEIRPMAYRWPDDTPQVREIRRKANGRFAKKD